MGRLCLSETSQFYASHYRGIRFYLMNMINNSITYYNIDWASSKDGKGVRVVLYFQGCHLDCPWCHSPHSKPRKPPVLFNKEFCKGCANCVKVCTTKAHAVIKGKHIYNSKLCIHCLHCIDACPESGRDEINGAIVHMERVKSVKTIFEDLLPQMELLKEIGGITFSGGEPLLQVDALESLLTLCKENGINTAVETSANIDVSNLKELDKLVDHWLLGIHPWNTTGCYISRGIQNFVQILSQLKSDFIIRMPVIPGFTDTPKAVNTMLTFLRDYKIRDIELLPFNPNTTHYYQMLGMPEVEYLGCLQTREKLNEIKGIFVQECIHVKLKT